MTLETCSSKLFVTNKDMKIGTHRSSPNNNNNLTACGVNASSTSSGVGPRKSTRRTPTTTIFRDRDEAMNSILQQDQPQIQLDLSSTAPTIKEECDETANSSIKPDSTLIPDDKTADSVKVRESAIKQELEPPEEEEEENLSVDVSPACNTKVEEIAAILISNGISALEKQTSRIGDAPSSNQLQQNPPNVNPETVEKMEEKCAATADDNVISQAQIPITCNGGTSTATNKSLNRRKCGIIRKISVEISPQINNALPPLPATIENGESDPEGSTPGSNNDLVLDNHYISSTTCEDSNNSINALLQPPPRKKLASTAAVSMARDTNGGKHVDNIIDEHQRLQLDSTSIVVDGSSDLKNGHQHNALSDAEEEVYHNPSEENNDNNNLFSKAILMKSSELMVPAYLRKFMFPNNSNNMAADEGEKRLDGFEEGDLNETHHNNLNGCGINEDTTDHDQIFRNSKDKVMAELIKNKFATNAPTMMSDDQDSLGSGGGGGDAASHSTENETGDNETGDCNNGTSNAATGFTKTTTTTPRNSVGRPRNSSLAGTRLSFYDGAGNINNNHHRETSLLLNNSSSAFNSLGAAKRGYYKSYTREQLMKALEAVQSSKMSGEQAAKHFKVPRSTLHHHLRPMQYWCVICQMDLRYKIEWKEHMATHKDKLSHSSKSAGVGGKLSSSPSGRINGGDDVTPHNNDNNNNNSQHQIVPPPPDTPSKSHGSTTSSTYSLMGVGVPEEGEIDGGNQGAEPLVNNNNENDLDVGTKKSPNHPREFNDGDEIRHHHQNILNIKSSNGIKNNECKSEETTIERYCYPTTPDVSERITKNGTENRSAKTAQIKDEDLAKFDFKENAVTSATDSTSLSSSAVTMQQYMENYYKSFLGRGAGFGANNTHTNNNNLEAKNQVNNNDTTPIINEVAKPRERRPGRPPKRDGAAAAVYTKSNKFQKMDNKEKTNMNISQTVNRYMNDKLFQKYLEDSIKYRNDMQAMGDEGGAMQNENLDSMNNSNESSHPPQNPNSIPNNQASGKNPSSDLDISATFYRQMLEMQKEYFNNNNNNGPTNMMPPPPSSDMLGKMLMLGLGRSNRSPPPLVAPTAATGIQQSSIFPALNASSKPTAALHNQQVYPHQPTGKGPVEKDYESLKKEYLLWQKVTNQKSQPSPAFPNVNNNVVPTGGSSSAENPLNGGCSDGAEYLKRLISNDLKRQFDEEMGTGGPTHSGTKKNCYPPPPLLPPADKSFMGLLPDNILERMINDNLEKGINENTHRNKMMRRYNGEDDIEIPDIDNGGEPRADTLRNYLMKGKLEKPKPIFNNVNNNSKCSSSAVLTENNNNNLSNLRNALQNGQINCSSNASKHPQQPNHLCGFCGVTVEDKGKFLDHLFIHNQILLAAHVNDIDDNDNNSQPLQTNGNVSSLSDSAKSIQRSFLNIVNKLDKNYNNNNNISEDERNMLHQYYWSNHLLSNNKNQLQPPKSSGNVNYENQHQPQLIPPNHNNTEHNTNNKTAVASGQMEEFNVSNNNNTNLTTIQNGKLDNETLMAALFSVAYNYTDTKGASKYFNIPENLLSDYYTMFCKWKGGFGSSSGGMNNNQSSTSVTPKNYHNQHFEPADSPLPLSSTNLRQLPHQLDVLSSTKHNFTNQMLDSNENNNNNNNVTFVDKNNNTNNNNHHHGGGGSGGKRNNHVPTKYTKDQLDQAIDLVVNGHKTVVQASKTFGIPYRTLYDYIRNYKADTPTPTTTTTPKEHEIKQQEPMMLREYDSKLISSSTENLNLKTGGAGDVNNVNNILDTTSTKANNTNEHVTKNSSNLKIESSREE